MFFKRKNSRIIGDFNRKNNRFYKSKKYSNPYFQKNKKTGSPGQGISVAFAPNRFYFLIICCSAVFLVWLFFYSSFFEIKSFDIKGGGRISPEEIENLAREQLAASIFRFLPQNNIFIFNTDAFVEKLNEKYVFDQLAVEKKLPGKLIVDFSEKRYALILQEGDLYYYADNEGLKIDKIDNILEISQKDYPLVENKQSNFEIRTKDEQEKIKYILDLFQELKAYQGDFKVEKFILNDDMNSVTVKLLDGPEIYFNSREDVKKQINKVIVIKNEKLKENFNTRQYIDVRIGDSVYYR